jgi:hypothetical protein
VSYAGFVNGETSAVLGGSVVFGGSAQGAIGAGSYAISPSGLSSTNYAINYVDGRLDVAKAELAVRANDAVATYDGKAFSGGNGVTFSGFVNGESAGNLAGSLVYGGNAQGASGAGSYTLAASGLDSGNYAIRYIDGKLTIQRAPLTISASGASKTYDGMAFSGGNGIAVFGLAAGESLSNLQGKLVYGGTAQGARDAGEYSILPSGLESANYDITYVPGSLNVNAAALTITANGAAKTYDGQAFSGGNGVAFSGFVAGESAANLGGTLGYGGSAQGAANAGSYAIVPHGLQSNNYAITYLPGTLTVDRAALTVTANPDRRVYNGAVYSGGNGVVLSGLAGADTAAVLDGTVVYGGTSQGASAAGQYTIQPGGLSSPNYVISYVDGVLAILPPPPVIVVPAPVAPLPAAVAPAASAAPAVASADAPPAADGGAEEEEKKQLAEAQAQPVDPPVQPTAPVAAPPAAATSSAPAAGDAAPVPGLVPAAVAAASSTTTPAATAPTAAAPAAVAPAAGPAIAPTAGPAIAPAAAPLASTADPAARVPAPARGQGPAARAPSPLAASAPAAASSTAPATAPTARTAVELTAAPVAAPQGAVALRTSLAGAGSPATALDAIAANRTESAVARGMERSQAARAGDAYGTVLVQQLAQGIPAAQASARAERVFQAEASFPVPTATQAAARGLLASGSNAAGNLAVLSQAKSAAGAEAFDKALAVALAKGLPMDAAVEAARRSAARADSASAADSQGAELAGGSLGRSESRVARLPDQAQLQLGRLLARGVSLEIALVRIESQQQAAVDAARRDAANPSAGLALGDLAGLDAAKAEGAFGKVLSSLLARGMAADQALARAGAADAVDAAGRKADASHARTPFTGGQVALAAATPAFDQALAAALARGATPAQALARARQAEAALPAAKASPATALASGSDADGQLDAGGSRTFRLALSSALGRGVPVERALAIARKAEQANAFRYPLPANVRLAGAGPVSIATADGQPLPSWLRFDPNTRSLVALEVPDGGLPMTVVITVGGRKFQLTVQEGPVPPMIHTPPQKAMP